MLEFNGFNLRISPLWQRLFERFLTRRDVKRRDAKLSEAELNVPCLVLEFNGPNSKFIPLWLSITKTFSREVLDQSLPGSNLTGLTLNSSRYDMESQRPVSASC